MPVRDAMASESEARLAPLMRAAQDGDAAAYRALLRDCVPVIAATARRAGLPPDRIDDVVQETLITIHRARATYDPGRSFLPWLRAIARRRAIDALRVHGRGAGHEVHDPAAYEAHGDDSADALGLVERQDSHAALREAVATLPDGQRQAVERLALAGQSLDEAAAATGRNKGALKVNLHRAIRALRARMAPGSGAPGSGVPSSGAPGSGARLPGAGDRDA